MLCGNVMSSVRHAPLIQYHILTNIADSIIGMSREHLCIEFVWLDVNNYGNLVLIHGTVYICSFRGLSSSLGIISLLKHGNLDSL